MIHNELHSKKEIIESSKSYISTNGCRAVNIEGYIFMEQNKNKNSTWANRAKAGDKITWIIPSNAEKWGRIINDKIEILI